MKLSLLILSIGLIVFSIVPDFVSAACKKQSELCKGGDDCCPAMGRRLVCAPSLQVCGKTPKCCVTEVEEQQEKQAAIIRNRPKSKRFWNLLIDELEDEEY